MTVLEVGGGSLAVHSAIRMADDDMRQLDRLGRVAWIIAPNPMHTSETPWYAARYPTARVFAPGALRRRLAVQSRLDGAIEANWPDALDVYLKALFVDGLRMPESAYLHVSSRTLVLTDLAFNFAEDHFHGVTRWLMRLNGVNGRFGPSRLLRWTLIRDRAALRRSIDQLLEWDFDRVIVNHGRVLESGGRERLAQAFRFLRA
jgi:hypothetical protein